MEGVRSDGVDRRGGEWPSVHPNTSGHNDRWMHACSILIVCTCRQPAGQLFSLQQRMVE